MERGVARDTILVVDDKEINRKMLQQIFTEQYVILEAENGKDAISLIRKYQYSLAAILLDVLMPVIDGFGVLEYMRTYGLEGVIPVILISASESLDVEDQGFGYRIADFIHKPFVARIVERRVENIIQLYNHKRELEYTVDDQTAVLQKQYQQLQRRSSVVNHWCLQFTEVLMDVMESRRWEPTNHIRRIKQMTYCFAKQLQRMHMEYELTQQQIEAMVWASGLHDIGMITITDQILDKTQRLLPVEYEEIKKHPENGCKILDRFEYKDEHLLWKYSYEVCRYHHERYDGKGYPSGYKEEELPVSSQIVAIADVYDALVHDRPYRKAYTHREALTMICDGQCGVFHPTLLEVFDHVTEDFLSIVIGDKAE